MKLKKRTKSRKMRGSRYHGYAAKKHKGGGTQGGKGMAGTGKRADQKKTFVNKYFKDYFGKHGKRSLNKTKDINVGEILSTKDVEMKGYKILGRGELKNKITIKADAFSKSALAKIEKAGGKAVALRKTKAELAKKIVNKKSQDSNGEGESKSDDSKKKVIKKEE